MCSLTVGASLRFLPQAQRANWLWMAPGLSKIPRAKDVRIDIHAVISHDDQHGWVMTYMTWWWIRWSPFVSSHQTPLKNTGNKKAIFLLYIVIFLAKYLGTNALDQVMLWHSHYGKLLPHGNSQISISIDQSINQSIYLSFCLSVYLPIYLPTYQSVYLFVYLCMDRSIYLSISYLLAIYLSISLSIHASIHPSIYLSTSLSLSHSTIYIYVYIHTYLPTYLHSYIDTYMCDNT